MSGTDLWYGPIAASFLVLIFCAALGPYASAMREPRTELEYGATRLESFEGHLTLKKQQARNQMQNLDLQYTLHQKSV
eukprot:663513-Rhodomonas_salina.2